MWHTTGDNVTRDEDRALLFGYYACNFLRPQVNWNAALSPETIAGLDEEMHRLLGLGPAPIIPLAFTAAAQLLDDPEVGLLF